MAHKRDDATMEPGAEAPAPRARRRRADPPSDPKDAPRSLPIASAGVRTGEEFAELMSAIMADVIDERLEVGQATAVVNAGRQLLRVVELRYRYGAPTDEEPEGEPELRLRG